MKTVKVDLGERSYPIHIGQALLQQSELVKQVVSSSQILIVTQANLESYLQALLPVFKDRTIHVYYLPAGEDAKNSTEWLKIQACLIEHHFERSATLIALGGGVVSDITGFVAATYLRGVNYISIPTSLMAQVDAAIGGKTAINHPQGKNLIGAFYQPRCVLVDIDLLQSLPDREYISGLAEVVKYALIADAEFFVWLEQNRPALLARDPQCVLYAVTRCIQLKVDIITQDERDQGRRNLLNFGHTLGHALEAATQYQTLLHGEAVAIGMLFAVSLSHKLNDTLVKRIKSLLVEYGLLFKHNELPSLEMILPHIKRDKKIKEDELKFVLLNTLGTAELCSLSLDEFATSYNHFSA